MAGPARGISRLEAPPPLGPAAVLGQRRLRRVSRGDAAQARRGAARVPRLSRPAALGQGPRRVRPVHGRAPQPSADDRAAAVGVTTRLSIFDKPPAMVTIAGGFVISRGPLRLTAARGSGPSPVRSRSVPLR